MSPLHCVSSNNEAPSLSSKILKNQTTLRAVAFLVDSPTYRIRTVHYTGTTLLNSFLPKNSVLIVGEMNQINYVSGMLEWVKLEGNSCIAFEKFYYSYAYKKKFSKGHRVELPL